MHDKTIMQTFGSLNFFWCSNRQKIIFAVFQSAYIFHKYKIYRVLSDCIFSKFLYYTDCYCTYLSRLAFSLAALTKTAVNATCTTRNSPFTFLIINKYIHTRTVPHKCLLYCRITSITNDSKLFWKYKTIKESIRCKEKSIRKIVNKKLVNMN